MSRTEPRRLRVAIVAASLRIIGGHSVQAQRLIEGWRGDEEVEAWVVPIDPVPPKPIDRLLAVKFVRTIVTQLFYWPLLVREVLRADIVHVFSASYTSFLLAPLPAVIVSKLLRRPVVLNYHSGEAPDHLRRSSLARFVLKHGVNLVVVPSPFLRDVFATFGMRAEVVQNSIDLTRFAYRVRDPLRPRLISTRNLEPLYNVLCTLRAFARIQARYPEATLTVVGAGSQEGALRMFASTLRKVTFTGQVDPSKMPAYYADADIYVQTPSIDNMPLSLLEAFASGLPVVATRTGGVPAMLRDGVHGLLVPDDDDEAVAQQVIRLLDAPAYAQALAAAARENCAEYEWPRVRAGWLAAYRFVRQPAAPRSPATKTLHRLRRMDGRELVWRARAWARIQVQRAMTRLRRPRWDRHDLGRILAPGVADAAMDRAMRTGDWRNVHDALVRRLTHRSAQFVLDPASAEALAARIRARWPHAAADAARRADRLISGRYDVLGYYDLDFTGGSGDVDWHLDPVHSRRAPAAFWADVPYLDPMCGDHKVIWEVNRHQHWLQLVRALWLTGDPRYGLAIVDRLESWLASNPPLVGINWASALENGFRSISWTWALHGLLASPESDRRPWLVDMLVALDRQLTHVEQNLSHYFSPNTHLTGEALALYVVGLALPELAASERRVALGREILLREIDQQIHADGGHAEGSTHYHRYTLDFYLLALLTAKRAGDTAAIPRFTDAVTRLAEFARAIADDHGRLPLIGDDDGGMLWPITGRACRDVRDSLALAAAVLGRADLAPWGVCEEVLWVGGRQTVDRVPATAAARDLGVTSSSRMFRESGYFIARDVGGGHAVFDVGRHGFMNGGHAHADALAITLTVGDQPLLVDPGTSNYMDRTRDQMRGTSSHNTVAIDGRPQSIPDGPFGWQTRSDARPHAWRHNPAFDWAEASHDGYAPLQHRRTLLRTSSGWFVVDEMLGTGRHTTETFWHFDPAWAVKVDTPGRIAALDADGHVVWLLYESGTVTLDRGNDQLGRGWYSPVYGTRIPAWVADVRMEQLAPFGAITWIGETSQGTRPAIERLAVRADSAGPAIAARVTAGDRASVVLVRPGEPATREARNAELPDYESDARVLHYASENASLVALDIIDGSRASASRDGWLSVTADSPLADLHIGLEHGTLDMRSLAPPPRLRFEGRALAGLRTIRINGSEWPMNDDSRSDAPLVIDAGQWSSSAGAPLATPFS